MIHAVEPKDPTLVISIEVCVLIEVWFRYFALRILSFILNATHVNSIITLRSRDLAPPINFKWFTMLIEVNFQGNQIFTTPQLI